MKNYEDMSDFEINKRVFKTIVGAKPLGYPHNADGRSVGNEVNGNYRWFDYCNNPSDAWPIIVDNEISINRWALSDGWGADRFGHFDTRDDKPLRAAMIVFLKMNEDKL